MIHRTPLTLCPHIMAQLSMALMLATAIPSVSAAVAVPVYAVAAGVPIACLLSTGFGARYAGLSRPWRRALPVTAPLAAWALWYRRTAVAAPGSGWRRFVIGWNVFGFGEHLVAVFLGTTTFPGPLQLFHTTPTTAVFAALPMALFPAYLVCFADTLHLFLLDVLVRDRRREHRAAGRNGSSPVETVAA